MKTFFSSLLLYQGRHNRKQFICSQLIAYTIMLVPLFVVGYDIVEHYGPNLPQEEYQHILFGQYAFITMPPVIIAAYLLLASYMKRLHDLGHAGWWALLILFPYIRYACLLYLTIQKGEPDTNIYGPAQA